MATHLNRKVGELAYDNLFAGMTPAAHVNSATIRKLAVAATYKRGTVLAKSSGSAGDSKLVILGTSAAENETLTPDCVLCDDTDIGTATDVLVPVYTAGCFNPDTLTVKAAYTITEADRDKLRERGIYLGAVLE